MGLPISIQIQIAVVIERARGSYPTWGFFESPGHAGTSLLCVVCVNVTVVMHPSVPPPPQSFCSSLATDLNQDKTIVQWAPTEDLAPFTCTKQKTKALERNVVMHPSVPPPPQSFCSSLATDLNEDKTIVRLAPTKDLAPFTCTKQNTKGVEQDGTAITYYTVCAPGVENDWLEGVRGNLGANKWLEGVRDNPASAAVASFLDYPDYSCIIITITIIV
eukprot:gene4195-14299_t